MTADLHRTDRTGVMVLAVIALIFAVSMAVVLAAGIDPTTCVSVSITAGPPTAASTVPDEGLCR